MLGFAEKKYLEKGGHLFWKEKNRSSNGSYLEFLVEEQVIPYVDVAIAKAILQNIPEISEEAFAFVVYLSMCSRLGHLAICLKEGLLQPDPILIVEEFIESVQNKSDLLQSFAQKVKEGYAKLPASLISEEEELIYPTKPICKWKHGIYFQRNWVDETFCLRAFQKILKFLPRIHFEYPKILDKLKEERMVPEQIQAIEGMLTKSFSILFGGPGTGKTYTASSFLKIFLELLSPDEKTFCRIVLTAPTGKAVAHLQSYFREGVEAMTLHQLLKISPSREKSYEEVIRLPYDLILVDECSMIDARMMAHLLLSVKEGARLILLGDPNQLPPIGSGSIFADLIESCKQSGYPVGELHRCMRTERAYLVELADDVKKGNFEKVISNLSLHSLEEVSTLYKKWALQFLSGEKNKFCLLSPFRKGPYGVESLNKGILQEFLRISSKNKEISIPIVITRNDFEQNLMNGDTGVLVCQPSSLEKGLLSLQKEDYALFFNPELKESKKIPALLLPPFEYAFCLSVHKSQGSEFEKVAAIFPEGSECFGREILYTTITRAKNDFEIWGKEETIQEILKRSGKKLSLFIGRFHS